MRFTSEGVSYLIEFERQRKARPGFVQVEGQPVRTSVSTTARLFKVEGKGKEEKKTVVREYTVTHNHRDRFSLEAGRKAALTMALYDAPTKGGGAPLMGTKLTKDFRTEVWTAYHNRSNGTE